jgi:CPA1 family monovalent cation:H+ antiporter
LKLPSFEHPQLQRNLAGILLLQSRGDLNHPDLAGILIWGNTLSLPLALVFGALIAATDPVAVVALFRSLGVPKRLSVLIEGESLLNDGTAIVVFNLMLVVALSGGFNLVDSIASFLRVAVGGTVIGLVLGWMISRLISRVDDYLIETTLTTVLAFGSYLVAEQLHFSGGCCRAAGLVKEIGSARYEPHHALFYSTSGIWLSCQLHGLLLIGLQVSIPALISYWQPVLWQFLRTARPLVGSLRSA